MNPVLTRSSIVRQRQHITSLPVKKHLHLRNAFVTSVLNIQLSCLAITFIVLVMQATQTPLELAMAAYKAQQHIPEEDRSSLRTVATD